MESSHNFAGSPSPRWFWRPLPDIDFEALFFISLSGSNTISQVPRRKNESNPFASCQFSVEAAAVILHRRMLSCRLKEQDEEPIKVLFLSNQTLMQAESRNVHGSRLTFEYPYTI